MSNLTVINILKETMSPVVILGPGSEHILKPIQVQDLASNGELEHTKNMQNLSEHSGNFLLNYY